MLKILGSVLILTASVGGCLTFLERFREEERQLLAMKEMLIIFEKQLEYVRLPIAGRTEITRIRGIDNENLSPAFYLAGAGKTAPVQGH